jgi:phytoene desaturase
VVEKRDKPGGRAYVYEDEGFRFDAGPTVLTAPNALEELFHLAGRDMVSYVDLMPVSPFYRLCWEDGYSFDYNNDIDLTNQQIAAKEPEDVSGYTRFLEYAEDVFQEGYVKLAHVPFLSLWSMVRVAPQLIRLKSYRSVYSIVSKFIRNAVSLRDPLERDKSGVFYRLAGERSPALLVQVLQSTPAGRRLTRNRES